MFVLPIPKWFFHVSDITYQLSGGNFIYWNSFKTGKLYIPGLPFIMYICLNKRVREEFLHLLRVCRKAEKSQVAVIPLGNSTVSAFNNWFWQVFTVNYCFQINWGDHPINQWIFEHMIFKLYRFTTAISAALVKRSLKFETLGKPFFKIY